MKRLVSCILAIPALLWGCAGPKTAAPEYPTHAAKIVAEIHDPASKYIVVASHRGDWRNYPENSGPFGEVAFGDLGDRFVAFAAPRPRRFGSGEGESRRKEQQKQFFHGLDGFGESVFSKKRYSGHRNTSSLCRGAKGRQKLSPSS